VIVHLFDFVPAPPAWRLDWEGLDQAYDWVRALRGCMQSPVWHAEGDVWIHTRMVLEALLEMPAWRALPARERGVVFLAALLHDVAKPACTRTEPDGHISARGHSSRGSQHAREILWRLDVPFADREQICSLIAYHQVPFFLVDKEDAEQRLVSLSQTARCDLLALVTEADARGRTCADQGRLIDQIELFRELTRERGCWQTPWPFESDHARFLYFQSLGRSAGQGPVRSLHAPAHDDTRLEVTVMSGLPGAGKDHWIATHARNLPVVSLDELRAELDVDPAGDQGSVVKAAYERARQHLRSATPFVWNATNVSRVLRQRVIDFVADYRARVRVVYVEAPAGRILDRNRARPQAVPEHVIERLVRRWTVPTPREAHTLLLAVEPPATAAP
jgi:predicted kinase